MSLNGSLQNVASFDMELAICYGNAFDFNNSVKYKARHGIVQEWHNNWATEGPPHHGWFEFSSKMHVSRLLHSPIIADILSFRCLLSSSESIRDDRVWRLSLICQKEENDHKPRFGWMNNKCTNGLDLGY